ncbi:MAG: UDP-N-acetylmuramoyl-L-alanine--D-glutamate ligase [Chloroflexia bacterium]
MRYVLGEHREADVRSADVIVRNPAVPRESPWLDLARRHGVPVLMEMNLFWAHCPAPIVAITGSKGKSTTTAWLGHTWRLSRPDTVVAGNLRVSALEALPLIGPDTPVVLELSSWQLESFGDTRIGPHVSCVTNIAPDHLNRYSDMADYASSKREIYRYQRPEDIAVLCWDDPVVRGFAADCPAQVRWFGLEEAPSEARTSPPDGSCYAAPKRLPTSCRRARLRGAQRLNALATAALADACGLPAEQIAEGLRTFKVLPDRMEPVAYINGVAYINDTTSTTPVSTIAALRTIEGPIALIAGGASKNVGFADLVPEICARVSYLALLEGSATDELQAL